MNYNENIQLHQHWNIIYVIASIGISFLGTYTTTTLSEQYRVSCKMKNVMKGYLYLIAMALSTGGVAIWSMHFVGMGSLQLEYHSTKGHELEMTQKFDITLTILSLLSAITSVFLGNFVASHDSFYRKEPHEIFAFLVEKGTQRLSLANMQNSTALWALTLFSELHLLILGGLITGFGVCLMHYVGMMSMTINMAITWDSGIVAASVIIACLASIAANWILFRLLALYPRREYLRIISAIIMCIAVCGMHYTGMMAATYHKLHPSPSGSLHWKLPLVSEGYIGSNQAIFVALTFGLSLSWILIMIALADLRMWHYSLTHGLNESRKMVMSMSRASRFDEDRLLKQSVDLGAQYERLNESRPYRLKSRPPSVNIDYGKDARSSYDPEGDISDGKRQPHSSHVHPLTPPPLPSILKKKHDPLLEEDDPSYLLKKKSSSAEDSIISPTSALPDGTSRSGRNEKSTLDPDLSIQTHELSVNSKRKSSRGSRIFPVDDEENYEEAQGYQKSIDEKV